MVGLTCTRMVQPQLPSSLISLPHEASLRRRHSTSPRNEMGPDPIDGRDLRRKSVGAPGLLRMATSSENICRTRPVLGSIFVVEHHRQRAREGELLVHPNICQRQRHCAALLEFPESTLEAVRRIYRRHLATVSRPRNPILIVTRKCNAPAFEGWNASGLPNMSQRNRASVKRPTVHPRNPQ